MFQNHIRDVPEAVSPPLSQKKQSEERRPAFGKHNFDDGLILACLLSIR